jgi:hypothetical protein
MNNPRRFIKWMQADNGDGWVDLMMGVATLLFLVIAGFALYGLAWAIWNGYWQPFAVIAVIAVLFFLAVALGHVTRILFKDKYHTHAE